MRIGVPKERQSSETRVAATPATVIQLKKLGFDVAVETGAGHLASFDDNAYREAGADIVSTQEAWQSDLIFKVNAPQDDEIPLMKSGSSLVSFIWPAQNPQLLEKLSAQGINVFAMDSVPRISRAQSLDALSSMANIAGYRASAEAALLSAVSSPGRSPLPVKYRLPKCWLSVPVLPVSPLSVRQAASGPLSEPLIPVLR